MLGATAVKARYDLIDKLSGQTWTKLAPLVLVGLASAAHEDDLKKISFSSLFVSAIECGA